MDTSPPDPAAGPALPATTAVWLVRHGETEWSRDGRHTGRTDLPLTDHGEQEASALAPRFADLHPVLVLCSPRTRAQRTAALAGLSTDAPDFRIDPDLAEWDYGDYEGLTSAQIRERDPDWTIFTGLTPGGETPEQVGARADRVIARARSAVIDGPVVLVGHGHINRVIGSRWIGLPVADGADFALGTAAPCLLGVEHSRPVVVHWNLPNPAAS